MSFFPEGNIEDKETLFRAIHPLHWNEEENRPTSALFKVREGGVSVDRDGERDDCIVLNSLLENRDGFGAGKINAGQTREIGTLLKPDPIEANIFHSLILDSQSKICLSNSKAKNLSKNLIILKFPSKM